MINIEPNQNQALQELGARLLERAEKVNEQGIFLGSPLISYFDGYKSLLVMQHMGLKPYHSVLEVGCGALRSGYWIINYLNHYMYHGIEPNNKMRQAGIIDILTDDERRKVPEFSSNKDFSFSKFGSKFDYVLACSVWSHAAKQQIEIMLDQFLKNTYPHGKFLTSYIPASAEENDYLGKKWVGKSHKSNKKGTVRHNLKWILEVCDKRNLIVEEMPDRFSFGNQIWLCIKKAGE